MGNYMEDWIGIEAAASYLDVTKDTIRIGSRRLIFRHVCLLYTSPSPRDPKTSRMPSSA